VPGQRTMTGRADGQRQGGGQGQASRRVAGAAGLAGGGGKEEWVTQRRDPMLVPNEHEQGCDGLQAAARAAAGCRRRRWCMGCRRQWWRMGYAGGGGIGLLSVGLLG
jgi:hypothetical protein